MLGSMPQEVLCNCQQPGCTNPHRLSQAVHVEGKATSEAKPEAKAKAQAEAKKETFAQGVQEDKKELEALMQEVVQKRIDSGI